MTSFPLPLPDAAPETIPGTGPLLYYSGVPEASHAIVPSMERHTVFPDQKPGIPVPPGTRKYQ